MEEAYGEPGESKLEETGLASKNGGSCQLPPGMSNGGAAVATTTSVRSRPVKAVYNAYHSDRNELLARS
jgi:hypothetical protein